jgi:hypothetical protein
MNEAFPAALTADQRDLLLQGLRYVRSSVMLSVRDPEPEVAEERARRMAELAELREWVEAIPTTSATKV